ncbi:MAG: DUF2232 domain-containing protein [Deltaproteobacteria bacterium]|nr:DUF2232 domain-containing protein [Deltaproteobacteria bacterium]
MPVRPLSLLEKAPVQGVLSALLFLSSLWAPPLGFLLCTVSPLPMAVASWRGGARSGVVALVVGAAAAWAGSGGEAALMYALYFGVGGAALGLAMRLEKGAEVVLGSYAALSVAAFGGLLLVEAVRTGVGPTALIAASMKQSVLQMKQLLLSAQAGPEATAAMEAWAGRFARVFPGALAALSLLAGWINGLALRRIAARTGSELPRWNTWRAPEGWIWLLIASGLLAVLGSGWPATLGLNLFIPLVAVYFLQGLAVLQHLFETKAFPPALRGAAYLFLVLQFPAALLVAGVGAFDLWLDFRARWSSGAPTSS